MGGDGTLSRMRTLVGTSGYNYDAWKGAFYPETLAKAKMLSFYASQLPTVEINYTFYRMPTQKALEGWAAQVPEPFRFALKAPQRITHHKRLLGAGDELEYFTRIARTLGARLGPLLFQLPPNFKKDAARLHDFLEALPPGFAPAFEFRHTSWLDDGVYQQLRDAGAALCVADTDEMETPLVRTARFGYFRLRREDYGDAQLRAWAERIGAGGFDEVFVYFKHEDEARGPAFARKMISFLAS
jgi:uncharacterized protein YecE (DUF72 family)